MVIRVLSQKQLAPYLSRQMQMVPLESQLRLDSFLKFALEKANEFVPSESGALYLDDPAAKWLKTRSANFLSTVACFGERSRIELGKKFSAHQGIVGRVYSSGQAYFSPNVHKDRHFSLDYDGCDNKRSVICVPISIRSSMIGVLELANKKGQRPYTFQDFELLKIFSDYISASIQNFLDAKKNAEKARRDHLTGLSNDRELHERLKSEMRRKSKNSNLGLLFIDLDGFKGVNDLHGHLAGSRVIAEVADVLKMTVKWPRAEIARYGGDEYVVVLPGAELLDATSVADDIRHAIEQTTYLAEETLDVPSLRLSGVITASIGVACLDEHVGFRDYTALIRAADNAMYEAKRRGKNKVCIAKRVGALQATRNLKRDSKSSMEKW